MDILTEQPTMKMNFFDESIIKIIVDSDVNEKIW